MPRSPQSLHHRQRWIAGASLVALISVSVVSGGLAATAAIAQSFNSSDTGLVSGSVMDLKSGEQNVAELATSSRSDQLLGVIANKPLVQLGGGAEQVSIVTSGLTPVLVSDINGTLHTGDKITASPINGVGMKANQSTTIFGTAQGNLSDAKTTAQTVTDKSGAKHQVHVGTVPAQINVTFYQPNDDKLASYVPSFLQVLSNSIAGRNVPALRVIVGFLALILGFVTVATMLYSAVRSDMIAIGRNPMAQGAIRKGMVQVVLTAVGILLLTVLVIYIILAT